MLTPKQEKAIELAEQYEEAKEKMKELKAQLQPLLEEIGIGTFFQDPDTEIVYKIVIPKGFFVTFDHIGYNRTKKDHERSATLSKKEAKENGFDL